MTKEQWERVRVAPVVSLTVFHDYYLEMGGLLTSFVDFQNFYQRMMAQAPVDVYTKDGFVRVTYETCWHRVFTYYEQKFRLCTI